mgnify:CR=1 FL=1
MRTSTSTSWSMNSMPIGKGLGDRLVIDAAFGQNKDVQQAYYALRLH